MPSRNACRQGSSDKPLSQPRVPIDAYGDGEHDGGDLVAGDLAISELPLVKAAPYLCVSVRWDQLTYGTRASVVVGALDRVYLAADPELNLIFFIYFSRFCSKLAKSYLELRVSK